MKKIFISVAALAVLVLTACGDSSKSGGLFGKFIDAEYASYDSEKLSDFYFEQNEALTKNPIAVEIDADVPLQTAGVNSVQANMNFYCDATTTRAGVYQANTCWAEAKTDDESYDFDMRFEVLLCDKEGKPIYSVPCSVYGLEKSNLQKRIVNPKGATVQLNFGIDTKPFYAQLLANVEHIRIVDKKANIELIDQLSRSVKQAEQDFNNKKSNQE